MCIVRTKYRGTSEYQTAYEKLKEIARAGSTIGYGEIAGILGIKPNPHIGSIIGRIVGAMSEDEHDQGKPMISAVVVNKNGELAGKPGPGFCVLAEKLGKLEFGATEEEKDGFWKNELSSVYATYK